MARLAELSSLYADVDFYNRPDLALMHPRGVLEMALAKEKKRASKKSARGKQQLQPA